eukprot:COSAG02_NODE_52615_length_306_cov_2.000000_1_plen_57_part_10
MLAIISITLTENCVTCCVVLRRVKLCSALRRLDAAGISSDRVTLVVSDLYASLPPRL